MRVRGLEDPKLFIQRRKIFVLLGKDTVLAEKSKNFPSPKYDGDRFSVNFAIFLDALRSRIAVFASQLVFVLASVLMHSLVFRSQFVLSLAFAARSVRFATQSSHHHIVKSVPQLLRMSKIGTVARTLSVCDSSLA